MCTVTVVPHDSGVRLLCNRDEQRTRLPAISPRVHNLSGQRALFPVDPAGGGTWVGVNDSGLMVALLNLRPARSTRTVAARSRGQVVLELLRCRTLTQAVVTASTLDTETFEPFRAVMVYAGALAVATSSGTGLIHCTQQRLDAPVLFTSSSLPDTAVEPPRRQLFERLVLAGESRRWLESQSRFHDHQWPDRPEISVRMERPDALTVSRTRIDVTNRSRQLLYEAPVQVGGTGEVHRCCSLH
jgi:hypothetical protein